MKVTFSQKKIGTNSKKLWKAFSQKRKKNGSTTDDYYITILV